MAHHPAEGADELVALVGHADREHLPDVRVVEEEVRVEEERDLVAVGGDLAPALLQADRVDHYAVAAVPSSTMSAFTEATTPPAAARQLVVGAELGEHGDEVADDLVVVVARDAEPTVGLAEVAPAVLGGATEDLREQQDLVSLHRRDVGVGEVRGELVVVEDPGVELLDHLADGGPAAHAGVVAVGRRGVGGRLGHSVWTSQQVR